MGRAALVSQEHVIAAEKHLISKGCNVTVMALRARIKEQYGFSGSPSKVTELWNAVQEERRRQSEQRIQDNAALPPTMPGLLEQPGSQRPMIHSQLAADNFESYLMAENAELKQRLKEMEARFISQAEDHRQELIRRDEISRGEREHLFRQTDEIRQTATAREQGLHDQIRALNGQVEGLTVANNSYRRRITALEDELAKAKGMI